MTMGCRAICYLCLARERAKGGHLCESCRGEVAEMRALLKTADGIDGEQVREEK